MSGLTGRIPANALRDALRKEADELERQRASALTSESRERNTYEKEMVSNGILWTDYYNKDTGRPQYSIAQMQMKLSEYNVRQEKLKNYNLQLQNEALVDTRKKRIAETATFEAVNAQGAQVFLSKLTDGVIGEINKKRREGVLLTTEEKVKLQGAITSLKSEMGQWAVQQINTHIPGQYQDPQVRQKAIDGLIGLVDVVTGGS